MKSAFTALVVTGMLACDRPRSTEPPSGELHIAVRDEDGDLPLLAHVELRRIDALLSQSLDLRGDISVPLPDGRYRVTASRGLEWTIAERVVDVAAHADVALRLRHVVRSDVLVACELRTDPSPTTPDARLLSIASDGFRFATAREREDVADYAVAASRANIGGRISFAPAAAVRSAQEAPAWPLRTYVDVGGWLGGWEQGYSGAPLDAGVVLASLRGGRSFVTNGPIVDVALDNDALGDVLIWRSVVHAHVRVRAAPWVDVTSIEIVSDGSTLGRADVGAAGEARFDGPIEVTLARGARLVSVVVRGTRACADGTPSEGARPFAKTSAIAVGAGPPAQ